MIIQYQAIDASGSLVADTLAVEDATAAYSELTHRGLTPVRIDAVKSHSGRSGKVRQLVGGLARGKPADPARASRKALPFFTAQMAIMLETGTPVAAALAAMELQISCPHWRFLIKQLRQRVEEGTSLAAAMSHYPNAFESIYTNMIAAGEMSGNMTEVFRRLAQLARQADRLRSKIIAAMVYPALLTTIAVGVLSLLVFFVLPRFESVFEEMKVDLPGSTKALLAVSGLVRHNVILCILVGGVLIAGPVYWLRSQHAKRFIGRHCLRVPIVGPLVGSIHLTKIFRLLGLLIESSVPLLEALELTAAATKNYLYSQLVRNVRTHIVDGQPMYPVLQGSPLVPPAVAEMIHTGEENGRVAQVLALLADHLDDKNETKVATLTSIMEPLILILLGIVVATVALSLVLPMFDLSRITG